MRENGVPEIRIPIVEELAIMIKEGMSKITFEARMTPGETARLLNFIKQGRPMSITIVSPQATMDLRVEEVTLRTGELVAAN